MRSKWRLLFAGFLFVAVVTGNVRAQGMAGGGVTDPSMMLALVPAAAQAGAPPCIKPGTRLTYYGMSASIPGSYKELVQDENGKWVDKNTGQGYSERDIPGSSGAGYNVVHVGTVSGGLVQLSTKLYTIDITTNRCLYSVAGGMVTNAGCASDFWIHPDVLRQVQEINAQGVRILRMPYSVGGKQYNAIRFQTDSASGYNAYVYDLDTGLMIYFGSRTQGKPVMTAPLGNTGMPGLGQGSTQLASGWIVEVTDVDVPWKNAAPPAWIGQFGQLTYSGMQTTTMPSIGSRLDRPMTVTLTPKARGRDWLRFTNQIVIQSIQGMPPEQVQQEGSCGLATIGGWWMPPEGFANLRPQQVIERHDLVGTTTVVSNVGPGFVTISETGPSHRIDCTYNRTTGMLSALTVGQQIGMANITHSVQLAGQR